MQKSRVEFQVVRPPSSREINIRPEKTAARPWVLVAASGGLALISAAFAVLDATSGGSNQTDLVDRLAALGANYALAGINADRTMLEGQCGVLSEDPRLKSTLATDGIDKASIADILLDLNKSAGIQMSAVLAPNGGVLASAGDDALEGMDLRSSNMLRTAKPGHPASDTWVLGARLTSVALVPITAGERLVAFLLLGRIFREATLQEAAKLSQTAGALYVGGKLTSTPLTPEYQTAFDAAVTLPAGPVRVTKDFAGHVEQIGDGGHIAKLIFISKQPNESRSAHHAATWTPTAALFVFAIISVFSKLKTRN
jgi:hypothetical protein